MKEFVKAHFLELVLLGGIIFIATLLRLYKLGAIPNGLNRDEASLGYTAYSLLHTGRDEHQRYLPLQIESFGDWKLPGYVYTLIPFVQLLKLTEVSVRLPSALAGIWIVGVSYWLMKELLRKEEPHLSKVLPLLVSFCLAVSPWSVHLSRIAYEAHLSLAFFMTGVLCFVLATRKIKEEAYNSISVLLYPVSVLFFCFTLFTYHAFQVFTPLMGVVILITFRTQLFSLYQHRLTIFLLTGTVTVIGCVALLITNTVSGANDTKFSGLSIFSPTSYAEELFTNRRYFGTNDTLLTKLYSNAPQIVLSRFFTNVQLTLSPEFLFIKGGDHGSHNFTGYANLYLFAFATVLLAVAASFKERKGWQLFILAWLAAALVAPAITSDSRHSIRFIPGMIPLEVLSAYGIYFMINTLRSLSTKIVQYSLLGLFGGLLTYNVFLFALTYFFVFPQTDTDRWLWHMPELTEYTVSKMSEYPVMYMQGESSSPYISFLFHHPDRFSLPEDIEFYEYTSEGFIHVQRLGKIRFESFDWKKVEELEKALLILRPEEIPSDKLTDYRYNVIHSIQAPNSKVQYQFIQYERQ